MDRTLTNLYIWKGFVCWLKAFCSLTQCFCQLLNVVLGSLCNFLRGISFNVYYLLLTFFRENALSLYYDDNVFLMTMNIYKWFPQHQDQIMPLLVPSILTYYYFTFRSSMWHKVCSRSLSIVFENWSCTTQHTYFRKQALFTLLFIRGTKATTINTQKSFNSDWKQVTYIPWVFASPCSHFTALTKYMWLYLLSDSL